jgi:hypothetical protein
VERLLLYCFDITRRGEVGTREKVIGATIHKAGS